MLITKATNDEIKFIQSHSLVVMHEATVGMVKPSELLVQTMASFLADGGYYLVFKKDFQIQGWIGVGRTFDMYSNEIIGMLTELYVFPRYRKQGIARKLFIDACQRLEQEGYSKVQLNVFAGNGAKLLYEELGFYDVMTLMEKKFKD
ncbi:MULTISPECIES: GNAT family N-acetyltransferase [unclassified Virgibacillus]|uniref:GNAT family N-acetyltransferase n=1 Tax=unclassified Virgibacillus TaxID=2620237 RepID=UPI0024DE89D2|nr:GNAT family N-acetyltransferase [Virgibacillus sp. LDC-1]